MPQTIEATVRLDNTKNADGSYKYWRTGVIFGNTDLGTPGTFEFGFFTGNRPYIAFINNEGTRVEKIFQTKTTENHNSVFMTGQCYMAGQDLKDMADDFGCLAFPKGPSASDYISYYEDNVMMIPSCYDAERAWKIAFAYDLYTQPISGFDTSDGWKSGYYGSMRDTRSVDETVQSFMDSSVLNPALFVPEVDLGADILWSLNATSSPAALTEAIRDAWNSKIEKVNTVK